jgi:hypothetical protein
MSSICMKVVDNLTRKHPFAVSGTLPEVQTLDSGSAALDARFKVTPTRTPSPRHLRVSPRGRWVVSWIALATGRVLRREEE